MAEKYLTGNCPHCLAKLDYLENEKVVKCNCCDNNVLVADLHASLSVNKRPTVDSAVEELNTLIQGIDSSESGLAYLDSFFATFDWDEYNLSSEVYIPSIKRMVEKNKVRNASNPSTWILEFQSISVPLLKKITGCKSLEAKMAENYNGIDDTNLYTFYDNYSKNINYLLAEKNDFVKALHSDIKFAEKYGASEKELNNLKVQLVKINQALTALKPVSSIQDIPVLKEAMAKNDKKVADELLLRGVDAEDTYQAALRSYSIDSDKSNALYNFNLIRGYKDVNKYIAKINKLFNYEGNLYEFAGVSYVPTRDKVATLNVANLGSKKKNNEDQEDNPQDRGVTFSLYEVVNQKPSKDASIKGISSIIGSYATKLFYFKDNKSICYYDLKTQTETKIDTAKANDYKNNKGEFSVLFTNDGTKFITRKKLAIKTEKAGCLASLKGQKGKDIANNNNYSICLIDMVSGSIQTIIQEAIDIMDFFDDKLFYTYSNDPKSTTSIFMMYDIETKNKTKLLDSDCIIHNVTNNKVIYSLWKPNTYNMNLYAIDLVTMENKLLEDNIYDYFDTIDGKVYYTIGNSEFNPLFSINLDGTERTEIMQNIEDIQLVRAGWMYVIKGNKRNRVLMKISIDGKKKVFICSRFYSLVKFTNGYVYYTDADNALHIVRSDGQNDKVIAEDLSPSDIIIDQNYIYYLRDELVDFVLKTELGQTKQNPKYSKSLYRMDLDGHNVKKLMFNVYSMKEYDETKIYISKDETVTYEITTPTSTKNSTKTIKTFDLIRYYEYDRLEGKINLVLTLGLPESESFNFNSGCLKKKTSAQTTFKEIPTQIKYERKGKASAGANFNEKTATTSQTQRANNSLGCASFGGSNSTSSNNSGCSSLLSKK